MPERTVRIIWSMTVGVTHATLGKTIRVNIAVSWRVNRRDRGARVVASAYSMVPKND
jgi:hypothetical protein